MQFSFDTKLNSIAAKVEANERLTFDEGVALYRTDDLNALGKLADSVRRKKHGRTTYYNVNRHFNHTNICVADCKFCGFYKRARQEGAYTHSIDEGIEIARNAVAEGATELHIVGGLNTKLPFEYYTDLFSALKREFPRLHLKALTMVELDFFARFYKMSDEDVIERLKAAGMDSCPGGGAEIFAEPTRSRICDHKCDGNRWLELSGKVHRAGLKTNATMLYGHIETIEDRVDHFVKLREQQDKTGGFQCFIPLAFYPNGTALSSLPGPDAIDNLKTIAVSRLMIDNFDHIKAYWVMLGKATAQTALHFGANDLDGTITDGGELTHSYANDGEVKMSKQELIQMIENAGFEAVERDTVYNRVEKLRLDFGENKMSIFRILITTVFLAFNFGCNSVDNLSLLKDKSESLKIEESKNQESVEKVIDEIPSDLLITMDKPLCQGFELCQIYKITVKSDGTVLFEGIKSTKFRGKTKGKIGEEKVKELIMEFKKANYFNLLDNYNYETCPNSFTDSHDVNTSIQMNGKKKSVKHYLGCVGHNTEFEKPLNDLMQLEDKIREISGAKRWIGERK